MSDAGSWVDEAETVIIGGGVVGCSIAYHLARAGRGDVLVVERDEIGAASSARAAGLVSFGRADGGSVRMVRRTIEAIAEIEDETGEPVDFRPVGTVRVAFSPERAADLIGLHDALAAEGVAAEWLDAPGFHALCPWFDAAAAGRRLFVPTAGFIDGARLAMAYGRAARGRGVRFRRGVAATGLVRSGDRIAGIETAGGTIRARTVVDGAGAWAAAVAGWIGLRVGAVPTRSHYWLTVPDGTGTPHHPNLMLPDFGAYFRPETGGMLVGVREAVSRTFDAKRLPADMDGLPLHDEAVDTDLLADGLAAIRPLAPAVDGWRFRHHIAGLSTYTPDGRLVLGAFPGVPGFLVATGCCGSGIGLSGGIGALVADLIAGRPGFVDPGPFRPDRFGEVDPSSAEFQARAAAARAGKGRGEPRG